jgi:tetratricopeptide (TPR) repeat protein
MQPSKRGKPNLLLRKQRLLRGWSLARVADELHRLCERDDCKVAADATMVWKWESGRHVPSSLYRDAFCRLYQLTADQLGFMDGTMLTPSAETQAQTVAPSAEAASVEETKEVCEVRDYILPAETEQLNGNSIVGAKASEAPTTLSRRSVLGLRAGAIGGIADDLAGFWVDDLLAIYARGIAACQDLYFSGSPHQVEAILPLYSNQTALLARQPSPLQQAAARLASQAQQLACELLTDREDFGAAEHAGRQAFLYGQLSGDVNLQVASLIGLANLGFHRKLSIVALRAYEYAVSLLSEHVTPLLKGRTYAGIAEVYAMLGQFQEAMSAMGLAYEHYPLRPEDDPAYPYLRASRYSLYVFGDAQSRLFLGQPKEANKALIAVERETTDLQTEPVTKLDMLYYQADIQVQQGELEASGAILTEAAKLAKDLGSRLYFNKLATSYHDLRTRWPRESLVVALEEVFQPW